MYEDWLPHINVFAMKSTVFSQGARLMCHQSCYEVTFVKYLFSDLDKTLFSVKDTALATLLYEDWLPQVNGFAANSTVYKRGSRLTCHHRLFVDSSNLLDKNVLPKSL